MATLWTVVREPTTYRPTEAEDKARRSKEILDAAKNAFYDGYVSPITEMYLEKVINTIKPMIIEDFKNGHGL